MQSIKLSLMLGVWLAIGCSFSASASEEAEESRQLVSRLSQECQVIRSTNFSGPIVDPMVFRALPHWLQQLAMVNSSRVFGLSIYFALREEAIAQGKKVWKPTFIDLSNETEEEVALREIIEVTGNKPQYWSEDFRYMTTTIGFLPQNWGFVGLGCSGIFAAVDTAIRGKLFAPHYGSFCMGPGFSSADSAAYHGPVYIAFVLAEKQGPATVQLSLAVIADAEKMGFRHSPSHPPHVIDCEDITVFLVPSCDEKDQFMIALGYALDAGMIDAEYVANISKKIKTFKELRIELENKR